MRKRLLSLFLVMAMVFGMLPTGVLAAERDEDKDQVRVIVENETYPVAGGAPWEGRLIDSWIDIGESSTAASCVADALAAEGYSQTGAESNYISEINGLWAGSAGGYDGWMVMINDWFANEGLGAFTVADGKLEDGDEIYMVYSMTRGEDIGGSWANNDKRVAAVEFSEGALSPGFDPDVHEYTLTLQEGTDSVVVTPEAVNKNFQVHTFSEGDEYKRTSAIPVEDGTEIKVICGDPEWPSMNGGDWGSADEVPAETYTFTVSMAAAETSDPCSLISLEVAIGGSTVEDAANQALTPDFDGSITEYSTDILDYQSDKNQRFVWVKADLPDGAAAKAKCEASDEINLTDGEWAVLQVKGGYFWNPTYSGPLVTGKYNELIITVSADGAEDKEYTVTIPMQPDVENQSLVWDTNLEDKVYFTKNDEDAVLIAEAQHKNRPLECEDEITYQWYRSEDGSNEAGTAIEGAEDVSYKPLVSEAGKAFYYSVASCEGLESITSNVIEVTVTDEAAPQSVTLVCDHPYALEDTWASALGGKDYIAKVGDVLQIRAVDENGNDTPVKWLANSCYGGTFDTETGIYTITGTSYSYIEAVSLYDTSMTSGEKAIVVTDYTFSSYNRNPSVTLANDGQSFKSIAAQGGIDGYNIWTYELSDENIAELEADLSAKPVGIEFKAMRPGTINISFDLDLDGDGEGDGKGLSDSAVMSINGISVEDESGKLGKTYLELASGAELPSCQLKALSSNAEAAFVWSSSDESIAEVDENGVVTAKSVGSAIISANDGTYTGGIKVVVTSAEKPYFEYLDFQTNNWNGLKTNWTSSTFKATDFDYTDLQLAAASVSSLTLKNTTVYDTEKYTAVAEYIDANGKSRSVVINSGAATVLPDIPFDVNTITITLSDKSDESKNTIYTFEVSRPRDTSKNIANNGITFIPEGRELWKDQYDGRSEGVMYVANSDGSFAQYQGVSSSRLYYRTYAMNALESFSLTLKGSTAYTHLAYSTDDGKTWTYLGQTGSDGLLVSGITFPEAADGEAPVAKIMIRVLDDKTYTANVNAGLDGFEGTTPNVYTVWVEQAPSLDGVCDIISADVSVGDWYPEFDRSRTDYRLVTARGAEAPILSFKVSEGAAVAAGEIALGPDAEGNYTLDLTKNIQKITITSSDGMASKTYSFGYSERVSDKVPDKVVDFLVVNSQYVNGNANGFGVSPQKTLTGGDVLSLGNFGGYVTYYYKEGLVNDPANAYGIDFYVNGNSFKDTATGTGLSAMEPGQVWVSEDGETWYALAGSEHYEEGTLWDYAVTYQKTATGGTEWEDNYGNTHESTHGRSFKWPDPEIYTMNDLAAAESFTLSGILLPCVDGTITGTDSFNSFSKGARFGYADVLINGTDNPYLENSDYSNASSGFDLEWAVDENGMPVDVDGKAFHYVKVVTASNIMAGNTNEKSTEVGSVERAEAQSEAVGVTDTPVGITISGSGKDVEVALKAEQQVYTADLGSMKYVSVKVNGTDTEDNIYINNIRVASGEAAEGIKVVGEKLVRVIVQNGDKEPVIIMLRLTNDAEEGSELIDGVRAEVYGTERTAETKDGENYSLTVGHRIGEIGLKPMVDAEAVITVNDKAIEDRYQLEEGENVFVIKAVKGDISQIITLTVTREAAPVSDKDISVWFKLLGDEKHGEPDEESGTHTLVGNNLETWIKKTAYAVPDTSTVLDVLIKALDEAGIDYVNDGGNYVSEIDGLGEFDNGALSGWMYTLNGKHPGYGIMEQRVEDGDYIIFHYTDDYTVEEGSNQFGDKEHITDSESTTDVNKLPFTDTEGHWGLEAIRYAYENGLMNVVAADRFAPDEAMTRAMLVTILWRLENQPDVEFDMTFDDVGAGDWYTEAVRWAASEGIVEGYSKETFAPHDNITREQFAVILYRYAGYKDMAIPKLGDLSSFADASEISTWAEEAMKWAVAEALISGRSETVLAPKGNTTRAEAATILMRYIENVIK